MKKNVAKKDMKWFFFSKTVSSYKSISHETEVREGEKRVGRRCYWCDRVKERDENPREDEEQN